MNTQTLQQWWPHITTAGGALIAIGVGALDAWHFHSFGGSVDLGAITLGLGALIGVTPPITPAVVAAVTPAPTLPLVPPKA